MATLAMKKLVALIIITLFVFVKEQACKPRISGHETLKTPLGQAVTIDCWANKSVTWMKLINKTGEETNIINEEFQTTHFDLLHPEYVDFPDAPTNSTDEFLAVLNIENAKETDAGVYICTYEVENVTQIKQRIAKKRDKFYSVIRLIVEVVKPSIDVGDRAVVSSGASINMTCSGEKPVHWVFLNNHTWGVQNTENITTDKTIYTSVLQLENVNYTDVGYYICSFLDFKAKLYDDFDNEDVNTASTFLFVKDLNHLLKHHDRSHISAQLSSKITIPCSPTFPEVQVQMLALDNSPMRSVIYDDRYGFTTSKATVVEHEGMWNCLGSFGNESSSSMIYVRVHYNSILSSPNVSIDGAWQMNSLDREAHTYDVIERSAITLNCSTPNRKNFEDIRWKVPPGAVKSKSHIVKRLTLDDRILETRKITNISKERDSGVYECYITNNYANSSTYMFSLKAFPSSASYLDLKAQQPVIDLGKPTRLPDTLMWIVFFRAYPTLNLNLSSNGENIIELNVQKTSDHPDAIISKRKEQYEIMVNWPDGEITIRIYSPTIRDVGTYTLSAEVHGSKVLRKQIKLGFFMKGSPEDVKLTLDPPDISKKEKSEISLRCSAYGQPLSELKILFQHCDSSKACGNFTDAEEYQANDEILVKTTNKSLSTGLCVSRWKGRAVEQGVYRCLATNIHGSFASNDVTMVISDSELEGSDYIQIELVKDGQTNQVETLAQFIEGDQVVITCRGNTLKTSNPLHWTVAEEGKKSRIIGSKIVQFHRSNISVIETKTKYSFISRLEAKVVMEMNKIKLTCSDSSVNAMEQSIELIVTEASAPKWTSEPLGQTHYVKNENEKLSLLCSGSGVPEPVVTWYKDGKEIHFDENDKKVSIINGNITLEFLISEDSGTYSCRIENREGVLLDFVTLEVIDPDAAPNLILIIIIGVISGLLLIVIICLLIKLFKNKKHDRQMKAMAQKFFNDGNPDALNPDLDLGEQADLLPYDNKFEFAKDKLVIDSLLGSGAFGNVFKATAHDLMAGVPKTTVAVKMIKSPALTVEMKTLRSELKIMIHIGRHINIVNLLGACSKNMATKGELLLIVEYCRHGNILEYMRRHKKEFINQINDFDKIDPTLRQRKRACSNASRASQRTTYAQLDLQRSSNYFPKGNSTECNRMSLVQNGSNGMSNGSDSVGRRRIQSDSADDEVVTATDMTINMGIADNYVSEATLEQRGPLCSKDLLHWAYQIANGMFYLSEKKVVHGDLAARNILLADKNIVKISDFGLSKSIYNQKHYQKKSKCPLPVKWLALEALRDSIFSTASDVWSYGVVLWEIFSLGQNPFATVDFDDQFIPKLEQGVRLEQPAFSTFELYQIMMECWQGEPNERPSFRTLEKVLGEMLGETEKKVYMKLNAQNEEINISSEHLKRLHTPSYDSRVRGFFTETDEMGYQVPISPGTPGIVMENETCDSQETIILHHVPQRKRSDLTISIHGDPRERESLLRETDENYLVMGSPTRSGNQHFTFDQISPKDTKNDRVIYTNLEPSIKSQQKGNGKCCYNMTSLESPYGVPLESCNEGKMFNFEETNPSDTDSVFMASNTLERIRMAPHARTKPHNVTYDTQHSIDKKHDSGIYSPSILQNNPIYLEMYNKNKVQSFPSKIFEVSGSPDSLSRDANYKLPKQEKQRTQSDSSSGVGSLPEDAMNTLEKKESTFSKSNDIPLRQMNNLIQV